MFRNFGLLVCGLAVPMVLFGGHSAEGESSDWICPNCGQLNMRPYPKYPCIRCGFPYDNRPGYWKIS